MTRVFHPPPHTELHLRGKSSARDGRRAVQQLLDSEQQADWHDDAVLVVSELVANALTACQECILSAWWISAERALRVEVSDTSRQMPIPQAESSIRVGGHGLRIVERLSTRWGVTPNETGKIVWFEIDG